MKSLVVDTSMTKTVVKETRQAGPDHQVLTVVGGAGLHRKTPCGGCPWRLDRTGDFPAEAFVHSARTSYDMSQHTFACHESGAKKPAVCAGFLLRGAMHNLSIRIARMSGRMLDVSDGGHALHDNYKAMAMANGVPASHPYLENSREA